MLFVATTPQAKQRQQANASSLQYLSFLWLAAAMMRFRQRTRPTLVSVLVCIAACAFVPCSAQSCELEVEVFESVDVCKSGSAAAASGSIVADGTCRTSDPSNNWLPGIYRAECQASDEVRFLDSGCESLDGCVQSGGEVCDGDNSVVSYMYARLSDPVYSTGGICIDAEYRNSNGDTLTAAFKFTGECSPDCESGSPPEPSPTNPPVPPPTNPPVKVTEPPAPTDRPLPAPTNPPVLAPTDPPVPDPTEKPIDEPGQTTDAPMESPPQPQKPEPPTTVPTTAAPSDAFTTSTDSPVSTADDPLTTSSSIQRGLRFQPLTGKLPADQLDTWTTVTEQFLQQENSNAAAIKSANITKISQNLVPAQSTRHRFLSERRGLQEEQALEISFTLEGTHDRETTLSTLFEGAFDTEAEQTRYLQSLRNQLVVFGSVESVSTMSAVENATAKDPSNSSGIIAGVVVAVAVTALVSGFVLWRRRQQGKGTKPSTTTTTNENRSALPQEPTSSSTDQIVTVLPQHQQSQPSQPRWTNEITLDLQAGDDISTLEGGTLPDTGTLGHVYDDPTATVDLNNYHHNAYGKHKVEDEGTALSKFSNFGSSGSASRLLELNDDASFEALFSPGGMASLEEAIGTKVKPLVVQASPGMKLGMILESESSIGLPYIRAVKPDSPFRNQVQEGDLVISVNKQDVTNMTAMEVSELISLKQFEHRTLVLVRPERKLVGTDASF